MQVELRQGGAIGKLAEARCGTGLSQEVLGFCEAVFAAGGAVLSGPGGGRFVYDLRQRLDLFFKISPLRLANALPDAGRLKPAAISGLDVLLTRENTGGVYQGRWFELEWNPRRGRGAEHHFGYSEAQVRRFLTASALLARQRRGKLTVVWKEAGLPTVSRLWRECAEDVAAARGVRLELVDIDLMAYRLIQEGPSFDVVAAPNLFGDVLADLGAVLLGSRGLSFSGNYTSRGEAVYQTNHGAARDLAGADQANPAGQIFAAAMMLRESFHRPREAAAIEDAVQWVWRQGWRTPDVAGEGSQVIGTREMGRRIAERALQLVGGAARAA